MKKNITISVDSLAYINAKNYTTNISNYLSECLENLSKKNIENDSEENNKNKVEEINNTIQELVIKKSILEMEIKKEQEFKEIRLREEKEKEKFKRWVCPICPSLKKRTLNFMDNISCSSCESKARDSKNTIIEYIEGN